jgi:hypothetical protein
LGVHDDLQRGVDGDGGAFVLGSWLSLLRCAIGPPWGCGWLILVGTGAACRELGREGLIGGLRHETAATSARCMRSI